MNPNLPCLRMLAELLGQTLCQQSSCVNGLQRLWIWDNSALPHSSLSQPFFNKFLCWRIIACTSGMLADPVVPVNLKSSSRRVVVLAQDASARARILNPLQPAYLWIWISMWVNKSSLPYYHEMKRLISVLFLIKLFRSQFIIICHNLPQNLVVLFWMIAFS